MPDIWATVIGPAYDALKAGRPVDLSVVWDDGKRLRAAHGDVGPRTQLGKDGSLLEAGLFGWLNQPMPMYPSNYTELSFTINTNFRFKPPATNVELYDFKVGLGTDGGVMTPFPGGFVGTNASTHKQIIVTLDYIASLKLFPLRPIYEAALERARRWQLARRKRARRPS